MITDLHKVTIVGLLTELKGLTNSRKTHADCSEMISALVEPTSPASVLDAWRAVHAMTGKAKP